MNMRANSVENVKLFKFTKNRNIQSLKYKQVNHFNSDI